MGRELLGHPHAPILLASFLFSPSRARSSQAEARGMGTLDVVSVGQPRGREQAGGGWRVALKGEK